MRRMLTGLTVAAAVLATVSQAQAAPDKAAAPTWSVAQSNTLAGEDGIKAITVAPTGSTWAAGYQASGGKSVPLVQHLLSGKWTTAKSPSSSLGQVTALDASSSKNVWAFGGSGSHAYGARWNGTKWTTTTMTSSAYSVQGAWALSASNVWAVGGDQTKNSLHWNGKSWKKVAMPVPARAIDGVSSTHVYAAGTYKSQPAVEHWTGSAWVLAKTPKLKLPSPDAVGVLNDIWAPSAGNIWAAGGFEWACGEDGDDTCSQPYLLHWNGKAWSTMTFPENGGFGSFTRITGDGGSGLWVMRYGWNPKLTHVVGDSVTDVTPPHPSGHDIDLGDLALLGTTVWAGGTAFPEGDPDDPTGNGLYLRTA
jgi:hypothetical protein